MQKRVYFYTQGCRLNQSETATLQQAFTGHHFSLAPSVASADIAVINTCTVTENGDADTRRLVRKMRLENHTLDVALIGCQSQVHKEQLLSLTGVKWVIGNADKMNTHHIIEQTYHQEQAVVQVPKIKRESFSVDTVSRNEAQTRATIKIQDGCDFYCAFCVIPFARGPARSRVFDNIIRECVQLAAAGYQEIVITGINVGTYEYEGKGLLEVIDCISRIEGIARIRISSIEPTTIPKALIQAMVTNPKLCRYLHIPLQSGSDAVLQMMARKYDMAAFREFVQWAHQTVPDVCIGTDVIVGFPGETDALFEETVRQILTLPIHYIHVFSYSDRKFARSTKKETKVAPQVIAARSKRLRAISKQLWKRYTATFQGDRMRVLFESKKKGRWTGLTDNYIRVFYESETSLKNTFKDIVYLGE